MKKLARFLYPYRFSAVSAVLLVFLQSIADLLLPRMMARIVDEGIVAGNSSAIFRVGGWMLAAAAAGSLAAILSAYFAAKSSLGFGRDLRAGCSPTRRASPCGNSTRSAPPPSSPGPPTT
jgi:ATP-binding cassette subfamily B protein